MYRDAKLKSVVYLKQLIHGIPHPNTHTRSWKKPTQYVSPNPPHPKASSRGHRAQGVRGRTKASLC